MTTTARTTNSATSSAGSSSCSAKIPIAKGSCRTPQRVAKSLAWLTRGYEMDVAAGRRHGALRREGASNMVMVRDIELYSLCEHHMLPFFGKAHIAYIPNGKIVGLSKLPRIVEVFARRLQVQERLTEQIAERDRRRAAPAGRRRRDRGVSPLHDDARRREAELEDDHERGARLVPGGPADARGVPDAGVRAERMIPSSRISSARCDEPMLSAPSSACIAFMTYAAPPRARISLGVALR